MTHMYVQNAEKVKAINYGIYLSTIPTIRGNRNIKL